MPDQNTMSVTPDLEQLLLNFESLGDNCEFGVFQRLAGLEAFGLFRFTYSPMPALLTGLGRQFSDLPDLDKIQIEASVNKELMVTVADYGFTYHSGRHEGEIDIELLRQSEKTKLDFLSRRLTSSLKSGRKIFVRKGQDTTTLQQATDLLAAMHEYGPATLLWVLEADTAHPAGSIERLGPYLLCGRMDRFAPYNDAQSVNFTGWYDICLGAHAHSISASTAGTTIFAPRRDNQQANLLIDDATGPAQKKPDLMVQNISIASTPGAAKFPRRKRGATAICQHTLQAPGRGFFGVRIAGLKPGATYTASLWIKLRPGPRIEAASLLILEGSFLRARRADPRRRGRWQRIEASAIAPANGIMIPGLQINAPAETIFATANWRFEEGLMVDANEDPTVTQNPAVAARDVQPNRLLVG